MKIIHKKGSFTIRADNNCLIAWEYNGRWILEIDTSIDMDTATKLFQRWHSLHTYASPEQLAASLNDAINTRLYITIGTRTVPVYWKGQLNKLGIEAAVNAPMNCNHEFSCRHDIPSGMIHYWIHKTADRQEIAIN